MIIPIGNIIAAYLLIGIGVSAYVILFNILDLNDIKTQARKSHFIHPLRFIFLWPVIVTQKWLSFFKWFWDLES